MDEIEFEAEEFCGECGSTNLYIERVSGHEWVDNQEVDFAYKVITCTDCGNNWMEEADG